MDTNTSVFGSQIENSSRPVNTTEIDANGELSFSCKSLKMLRSFHLNIFYVCSPLRKSDRMGRTFTILRYWKFNQLYCVHFIGFYIYEVPVGIIVLLSIFYGSISIIAVIGNSLVIWIVATTRQMQTVTNLFIANLALADVVIGMFVIPFQVFFQFNSIFISLSIHNIIIFVQSVIIILLLYCLISKIFILFYGYLEFPLE